MTRIEWSPALELGIPELDAQHRVLVDLTNRLFETLKEGKYGNTAEEAVSELLSYSQAHFDAEEAYFAKFNLPEMESHAAAHRGFIAQIRAFEDRIAAGDPAGVAEILAFAEGWVKRHISREDKVLARHASQANGR